jgi:hypothetical protein
MIKRIKGYDLKIYCWKKVKLPKKYFYDINNFKAAGFIPYVAFDKWPKNKHKINYFLKKFAKENKKELIKIKYIVWKIICFGNIPYVEIYYKLK